MVTRAAFIAITISLANGFAYSEPPKHRPDVQYWTDGLTVLDYKQPPNVVIYDGKDFTVHEGPLTLPFRRHHN